MENEKIAICQKLYNRGIFSFKFSIYDSLKFYYASYILQKEKHKKDINTFLFISSLKGISKSLSNWLKFYRIPRSAEYRVHLNILSEMIDSCPIELVRYFEQDKIDDESIDELIKEYFKKKDLKRNPHYNANMTSLSVKELNIGDRDLLIECKKFAVKLLDLDRKPRFMRFGGCLYLLGILPKRNKNLDRLSYYFEFIKEPIEEANENLLGNPFWINSQKTPAEKREDLEIIIEDLDYFISFFKKINFKDGVEKLGEERQKLSL